MMGAGAPAAARCLTSFRPFNPPPPRPPPPPPPPSPDPGPHADRRQEEEGAEYREPPHAPPGPLDAEVSGGGTRVSSGAGRVAAPGVGRGVKGLRSKQIFFSRIMIT